MDKAEKSSTKAFVKGKRVRGIVTAQKCVSCGHHEIGIVTQDGHYIALKPGMRVEVIGDKE